MSRRLYEEQPLDRLLLTGRALEHARPLAGGRALASVLTRDDFAAVGGDDTENIVEALRAVRGVRAAVFVREAGPDGAWRVSLRTADPAVDVSEIARQGGGGGHRAAAGFSTPARPRRAAGVDRARARGPPRPGRSRWLRRLPRRGPPSGSSTSPPARPRTTSSPASAAGSGGGRRSGHAGTLDPFATGLLVVLVGRATRLADFLSGLDKSYRATIRTGFTSATGDTEGPIERAGEPAEADALRAALPAFTGRQRQRVPAFAAVKVGGERLYRKARAAARRSSGPSGRSRSTTCGWSTTSATAPRSSRSGAAPEPTSASSPPTSASGLGCGAYLTALRRTAVGGLSVEAAVPPEAVATVGGLDPGRGLGMPERVLSDDELADVRHGRPVAPGEARGGGGPVALLAPDGRLVAVARPGGSGLRPAVVLEDPA